MKNFVSLCTIVAVAALLSGCATPARVDQMASTVNPAQRIVKTVFRDNIAVRDVTGGQETNPLWTAKVGNSEFEQALEISLRDAGLLANGKQSGKYQLTAQMDKVDQPLGGFSMTVSATVSYALFERSTGKEILRRTITLPYTAEFNAAFMGSERLKIATEGAIKANIGKIIDDILLTKADAVALN
ncbi:MAG: hypothetical protein ACJ8HI_00475 [Massilia sp.]